MARNLEPQEEEVPNCPQPEISHAWNTEQGMAPSLIDGHHRFLAARARTRSTRGIYSMLPLAATARTRTTRGIYSMLPLGHTHETTDKIHEIPYMPQYLLAA